MTDRKAGINLRNNPSGEKGKEQKKESPGCVTFEDEEHTSTCNNRQEKSNFRTTKGEIVVATASQTGSPVKSG